VFTTAPDSVAGTTVAPTNSAAPHLRPTRSQSRPLPRPTTPGTGGRSVSQVPCPRRWLPRRLGGSLGAGCGTPFFPRVLVHLVGLGGGVQQRGAVGAGQRAGLDLVPQFQQVRPAQPQLARELGGGHPLGDPAQDQEDRRRGLVGPLPGRAGVQVEEPASALAAVVDDRRVGPAAVDGVRPSAATGAGQASGVEQIQEPLVASGLVHQVFDREIHRPFPLGSAVGRPGFQETRWAGGGKGPTNKRGT
jgi:hypothetical protein